MPRRSRPRRALRAGKNLLLSALSAAGAFAVTSSPGCGTDAHGIEDCRQIEQARCEAAAPCGIVDNTEKCQLFYRDHCLHGLAGPSPEQAYVDLCVTAIKQLGECARVGGPQAEVAGCGVRTHDATLACEVIQFPERAYDCQFLTNKPAPPEGGAGQGGAAGSDG